MKRLTCDTLVDVNPTSKQPPHEFRLPLTGEVCIEPVTFFLGNVSPIDTDCWGEFADLHLGELGCFPVVAELAGRILDNKKFEPVVVGYGCDGVLRVMNGHHRVLAYATAGVPIPYITSAGENISEKEEGFVSLPAKVAFPVSTTADEFDLAMKTMFEEVRSFPVGEEGWATLEFLSGQYTPYEKHFSVVYVLFQTTVEETLPVLNEKLSEYQLEAVLAPW